jgi:hypothetical protein
MSELPKNDMEVILRDLSLKFADEQAKDKKQERAELNSEMISDCLRTQRSLDSLLSKLTK